MSLLRYATYSVALFPYSNIRIRSRRWPVGRVGVATTTKDLEKGCMSFKDKALQRHVKELLQKCHPSLVLRMMAAEINANANACPDVALRQQLASDLVRFSDAIAWTEQTEAKQLEETTKSLTAPSRIVSCDTCSWRGSVRMAKTIEGASTLHCPKCEHCLC